MVRLTDSALLEAGWDALVKRLGVAGAVRFLQQAKIGEGDYTKTHQAWAASISRKQLFELVAKARTGGKIKPVTGHKRRPGTSAR